MSAKNQKNPTSVYLFDYYTVPYLSYHKTNQLIGLILYSKIAFNRKYQALRGFRVNPSSANTKKMTHARNTFRYLKRMPVDETGSGKSIRVAPYSACF